MTNYFLDSSALAKLYHPESGTQIVQSVAQAAGSKISISRLAEIEVRSSTAIKVRSKALTRADGEIFLRRFQRDLLSNRFEVRRGSNSDFDLAGRLIERYAFDYRLRSLDALQLAVALKFRNESKLDYFVAADKVLCEVAALEGLAVINPDTA